MLAMRETEARSYGTHTKPLVPKQPPPAPPIFTPSRSSRIITRPPASRSIGNQGVGEAEPAAAEAAAAAALVDKERAIAFGELDQRPAPPRIAGDEALRTRRAEDWSAEPARPTQFGVSRQTGGSYSNSFAPPPPPAFTPLLRAPPSTVRSRPPVSESMHAFVSFHA